MGWSRLRGGSEEPAEAGRRAVRTSPALPRGAGRAGRLRGRGSEQSVTRSPPSSAGSRTGTARCSTHHHSPPTCAGHRSSSSSSPRREGAGGSIVTAYRPPARAGGEAAGPAGARGGPGFSASAAPAAAAGRRWLRRRRGGPSRARRARRRRRADGAASACVSRGARSREEIRAGGGGGRGAGPGQGRGPGRLSGWQLRQSGGGTLGREPRAPGRQTRSDAKGGSEGPGRGPSARGCGTRLPHPLTSPLAEWEPPAVARSRGQGGAGK